MFYFLTDENRGRVLRAYRRRLFSLYAVSLSFVSVLAAISLIPSIILVSAYRSGAITEKESLSRSAISKGVEDTVRLVEDTSEKLAILGPITESGKISVPLLAVISHLPRGVVINSIYAVRGEEGVVKITGSASTRESLVAFSKSLEGDAFFDEVNLPVSNLTKSRDVPFSIELKTKIQ